MQLYHFGLIILIPTIISWLASIFIKIEEYTNYETKYRARNLLKAILFGWSCWFIIPIKAFHRLFQVAELPSPFIVLHSKKKSIGNGSVSVAKKTEDGNLSISNK